MDAFQGCYKFEPYDCRYFSGFYLFLRVAILVIFLVSESAYVIINSGMAIMPAIAFLLIINCKPYAVSIYNTIDAIILIAFALFCYGASAITLSSFNHKYRPLSMTMTGIGLLFPTIYASVVITFAVLPKSAKLRVKKCLKRFASANHNRHEDALLEITEESDDSFLLDRN